MKENNPILKVVADSIIDKFNLPDKYRESIKDKEDFENIYDLKRCKSQDQMDK